MTYAQRVRSCLLGSRDEVEKLREIKMDLPKIEEIEYEMEEINRDLSRTYPNVLFFKDKHRELRNVLLWYSYTNACLPYCQSFSFLCFVLYKIFYDDDPSHAMIDTYYAMHKLLLVVRPTLPVSAKDEGPLEYLERLERLIFNTLVSYDKKLYNVIKNSEILRHLLIQGFSSFYLNWFGIEEGKRLIHFIVDRDVKIIFKRLVMILISFLMVNRNYFLNFSELTCMDFMSRRHGLFNFESLFWQVNLLSSDST